MTSPQTVEAVTTRARAALAAADTAATDLAALLNNAATPQPVIIAAAHDLAEALDRVMFYHHPDSMMRAVAPRQDEPSVTDSIEALAHAVTPLRGPLRVDELDERDPEREAHYRAALTAYREMRHALTHPGTIAVHVTVRELVRSVTPYTLHLTPEQIDDLRNGEMDAAALTALTEKVEPDADSEHPSSDDYGDTIVDWHTTLNGEAIEGTAYEA